MTVVNRLSNQIINKVRKLKSIKVPKEQNTENRVILVALFFSLTFRDWAIKMYVNSLIFSLTDKIKLGSDRV